jgi:hypothetical protein
MLSGVVVWYYDGHWLDMSQIVFCRHFGDAERTIRKGGTIGFLRR